MSTPYSCAAQYRSSGTMVREIGVNIIIKLKKKMQSSVEMTGKQTDGTD